MRLCAIGCGQHAWSSHGPSQAKFVAAHPEWELAACCDVDEARAQRYAERFGFAKAYADAAAMLERETADAAVLVVPEALTTTVGQMVLARRVPLLLEKPPGRSVAECDLLIAAAEGNGRPVPHQVALNRRYVPLVRDLRLQLEATLEPGQVQHIHYEMTRFDRRDPDFSVTAIHGIDAVRYLARSDYARVQFRYQERPDLGPGVANIFMEATMAPGPRHTWPSARWRVSSWSGRRFTPLATPSTCRCRCGEPSTRRGACSTFTRALSPWSAEGTKARGAPPRSSWAGSTQSTRRFSET